MSELARPAAGSAVLSPCGAYRYLLTRRLGAGTKHVTFIMLNPSTADAESDDATARKCMGFARRWGCARLRVVTSTCSPFAPPTPRLYGWQTIP